MALVNKTFTVNVTPGAMPPIVHVSEYDVGRAYTVSILDEQGNTFTIPSGTTASIEGTLNGSVGFTQNATVNSNNTVSFTLSESMTAYSGKAWCKIKLTQNSQPIQTCAFVLAVDRAGVEADTVIGAPGFEEQIQDAVEDWAEQQGFTSPTVDITPIEGGHRVTFTDVDGTESMDVMDGQDGEGGDVGFDKLTFGEFSGKQKLYFANRAPVSDGVYGDIGRIIECKPGDTIYMNGTMGSNSAAKIMSSLPSGQYGAITNQIGTLEQTVDNTYIIPTNLSSAVCVFFPCWFGYFSTEKYQALNNGVIEEDSIITGTYTAGTICPMVSFIPFTTVPAYVQQYMDKESFWIDPDYNKVLYASLFAAASDLVGAKVAIAGDSLTQQSAGMSTTNSGVTGFKKLSFSGYGWASRFARKYMMDCIVCGVGQMRWNDDPNGGVYAVRNLIASDFVPDYVILQYGGNEIDQGVNTFGSYDDPAAESSTTSAAAIRWCIESLQTAFPYCKILVVMPCQHKGEGGSVPAGQYTYYDLVNRILNDYGVRRVEMAYVSGIVKGMGNPDGSHLGVPDGQYTNNNTPACEKYSRAIEKALLSM